MTVYLLCCAGPWLSFFRVGWRIYWAPRHRSVVAVFASREDAAAAARSNGGESRDLYIETRRLLDLGGRR